MSVIDKNTTFLGYRRENGRVGVRNHVIILPLDDLSNAASEAVAHNIKGSMAIPHPYGRLQFGADLDLHFRTLIGTGCNPNVAAVVVIGIEDGWTKKVVDGIAATGKPVVGFGIEGHGDHDTIMRASKAAREFVQWASEKQREVCPLHELWVSTKCGESDTTSGCGANPTVGNAFDKLHALGSTLCFGETTGVQTKTNKNFSSRTHEHLRRQRALLSEGPGSPRAFRSIRRGHFGQDHHGQGDESEPRLRVRRNGR